MVNLFAIEPRFWFSPDWRIELIVGLFLPAIVLSIIIGLQSLIERIDRAPSKKTPDPEGRQQ